MGEVPVTSSDQTAAVIDLAEAKLHFGDSLKLNVPVLGVARVGS
jgi:hypothetical protein